MRAPRGPNADPDRREEDALEHSEDPCPYLVRRHPLEQRQACDVDEYVADSDDAEAEKGQGHARAQTEQNQRDAPEQDSESENRGEAAGRDHAEQDDGSGKSADAVGRVEETDPRRPEVENAERRHDEQDAHDPGDHGLRTVEPDDEP